MSGVLLEFGRQQCSHSAKPSTCWTRLAMLRRGTVPFQHPLLLDTPGRAVAADVWGLLVTIRDLFAASDAWDTVYNQVDDVRWAPHVCRIPNAQSGTSSKQ